MLQPCQVTNCPHAKPCPTHGHLAAARYGQTALKPAGGTRLWRRRRRYQLARSPLCHVCGELATEVGHVLPRADGGSDDPANLRSLCHAHHVHTG
jgi:5-methylcytosine-specific restriction endonuclease McrA